MFWIEEDVQPAIDSAVKLFGPPNQYSNEVGCWKNVSIISEQYGKLWFGDIDLTDEIKQKLEMLSVTINQKIYLTFDYHIPLSIYETTSKLRETD